jgi:hypothetical protein
VSTARPTPAVDALRHSASAAYVVLDEDDRITHVSSALHDHLGRWIGHVLWEHLPGAREICTPTFEQARATGLPVEAVVFYDGRLERLTAIPGPDGLAVHVERLAELDLTNLATLTRSLERIAAELADRASARSDRPARASLPALP